MPATPATVTPYTHKHDTDPYQRLAVQNARDALTCACGHPNVSHGYTTDDTHTWPDGSGIGLGPCGNDNNGAPCACMAFIDPGAPTASGLV